jgi:hypothetical protein
MTPSQVCSDPEYLKNEVYEILLKSLSQRYRSETGSMVEVKQADKNMRPNRFKVEERGTSAHSRANKHSRGKSHHAQTYDTFSPMAEPIYQEEPLNSNSPTFYDCYDVKEEYEIIELIQMMPTDPTFTQRLKERII